MMLLHLLRLIIAFKAGAIAAMVFPAEKKTGIQARHGKRSQEYKRKEPFEKTHI